MQHVGKLQSWNDERGYGFIAPTHGGAPLFVHISAFRADGSRPTVGETLSYEAGAGPDGRPQALQAWRQALGRPGEVRQAPVRAHSRAASSHRGGHHGGHRSGQRGVPALLVAALLLGLGAYGYRAFDTARQRTAAVAPAEFEAPTRTLEVAAPAAAPFRCDGRTRCTQMHSCEEATYFLRHCPGTAMDGDGDGVPCEQQWCGGAR